MVYFLMSARSIQNAKKHVEIVYSGTDYTFPVLFW
jgi:hypothetical protein